MTPRMATRLDPDEHFLLGCCRAVGQENKERCVLGLQGQVGWERSALNGNPSWPHRLGNEETAAAYLRRGAKRKKHSTDGFLSTGWNTTAVKKSRCAEPALCSRQPSYQSSIDSLVKLIGYWTEASCLLRHSSGRAAMCSALVRQAAHRESLWGYTREKHEAVQYLGLSTKLEMCRDSGGRQLQAWGQFER